MRPLQVWVPDTRRKSFVAACRKQAAIVAQADRRDRELLDLLDRAAAEIDAWKA
ncbi:MAG: antitoxin MazE family protein [Burkholderiaceae bacterium]|nr:antitoxin MazE family protein [Burkholderiaceae bacterium]